MKVLYNYINGNTEVTIYEDGTKVKVMDDDEFRPDFPESMDCKITNWCNKGCPWCHEKSTVNGKHGDILNYEFLRTLRPGTEMAIGGGMVTSHPQLREFLGALKVLGVIANTTVHQEEFMENYDLIKDLIDNKLIRGLGISFKNKTSKFLDRVRLFPNAVIHVINGVVTKDEMEWLADNGLKVLVLGYKDFGRGKEFDQSTLQTFLERDIIDYTKRFKVVSFDNLAIKQLDIQSKLPKDLWERFYQGTDYSHTMYIDLVKGEYSTSSTGELRKKIKPTIDEMFKDEGLKEWAENNYQV